MKVLQPTSCPLIDMFGHQLANEAVVMPIRLPSLGTLWEMVDKKYLKVVCICGYVNTMLGNDIWYSEPDNNRKAWAFLSIETHGEEIVGWWVCYGNSAQIVKVVHVQGSQEPEALERLVNEIQECRRGTVLITYNRRTLPILRRRILKRNTKGVSLRGLKHVCIQDLLDRYFGSEGGADDADRDPSSLWTVFTRIGPLVPAEALEGDPL